MNYDPNPHDSHKESDLNLTELSQHHTIGEGPTEAVSLSITKRHFFTKTEVAALILAATPVGSISMWGGPTAPTNYMLCDGAPLSRTAYPELFAVVGTSYGAPDVDHFSLPSLKGKVPVGYDNGQTEFDTLGETGGEKTHTITLDEMPSHQHEGGAHSHNIAAILYGNALGTGTPDPVNSVAAGPSSGRFTAAHSPSSTELGGNGSLEHTSSVGSDAAHNNLQPYLVLNYIIKVV